MQDSQTYFSQSLADEDFRIAPTSLSRCFATFRRSFCLFFWRLRVAGFLLFPILPALRPSYLSDLKHRAPKGSESTAKWTVDSTKDWFAVGNHKRLPNEVGGRQTTLPENASKEARGLLRDYGPMQCTLSTT